ncbi:MAG: FeoA domain-containing protein [Anaerolineae bacterium]|nr:FeoA domain-containing protein [Thermoflexales bacterium]MDW8394678.1 FeoA domain-containing protein [Anaerolineae bacterium]
MEWLIPVVLLAGLLALALRSRLAASYRAWRAQQEREQVEDALKHLLNREHQGRHASPESLSGALGLSRAQTVRLIERMEAQGLLQSRAEQLHLTPAGERWALNVLRAHRLWERYLADEARMPLAQIHAEAHRREHTLSEAEVEALEANLGYPQQDPHGDPIPDRAGEMPSRASCPLTDWPTDEPGRIVHIEDEPAVAYQQIAAAGLKLGQTVRVLERTPQRLTISDGENEYRLAPAIAANVSVSPLLPTERVFDGDALPLSKLPLHREGEVVQIDPALQGLTRRRLLDLGLTVGATVRPEMQTFVGEPRAYRVRGTLIALRKEQADHILVRPIAHY